MILHVETHKNVLVRTIHDKRTILNGNVKMKKSVRDENGLNEFLNLTYLIKPLPKNKMLVLGLLIPIGWAIIALWLAVRDFASSWIELHLAAFWKPAWILDQYLVVIKTPVDQNLDGSKFRWIKMAPSSEYFLDIYLYRLVCFFCCWCVGCFITLNIFC